MLKKFDLDKINGTKHALLFFSQALAYHSFIFNLQFSYELKHKVRLSKTVEFFIYDSVSFSKVYILVQQNAWTPFKIKTIQKPHIVLLPDL